jgi:zinc protease
MRRLAPVSILFVFLLSLGGTHALRAGEDFAPLRQRIVALRLENGLRVILCPRGTAPIVSCVTCVLAGSADEGPGQAGFANLLARMTLDENPDRLRQSGAQDLQATAGADATLVTVSLPVAKLETWAELEATRLKELVPGRFEAVRGEALNALGAEEQQPFGWLSRHFLANAFARDGYGHPRSGLRADVTACTPEALRTFFRATHTPARTVIVVAGGFDVAEARRVVTAHFSTLPATNAPALAAPEAAAAAAGTERRLLVEFPAAPILLLGYPVPPRTDAETPVLDVLAELAEARLGASLVQTGLARSAAVWFGPGVRRPRLLQISTEPEDENAAERLVAALDEELAALRKTPATPEELQTAVSTCRARRVRELVTPLGLAARLAECEALDGGWEHLFAAYRALAGVSAAQVQAAAARYLVTNRRTFAELRAPGRGAGAILGVPVSPPGGAR